MHKEEHAQKVGVLVEGTIGDSLILVPTLRLLQQQYPSTLIHVIAFTDSEAISAGAVLGSTFPEFGFSIIDNRANQSLLKRLVSWSKLAKLVRKHDLEKLVYAFRPESELAKPRAKKHQLMVRLFSRVETIGFDVDAWPAEATEDEDHKKENLIARLLFKRIASALKADAQFKKFDYKVSLARHDLEEAESWIRENLVVQFDKYFVVCVSAKTASQRWPNERYRDVIRRLNDHYDLQPVFIGSPSDRGGHKQLISELGFGVSLAGESLACARGVISRAQFYLGNDTGPMHLAAALGLACVVVQSSRNPVGTWDPLGDGHTILRKPPSCAGCRLDECNLSEQLCLLNISVDEVLSSCHNLLSSHA